MSHEPTTTDILDAVQDFATSVDKQFDRVDRQFERVDKQLAEVKQDIKEIKAVMVTKDYLNEKLTDLRGDLTVLIRKEDNKVKDDRKHIFSLEPFAQA